MMLLKEKRKLLVVRMFYNTHKNSTFSLLKAVLKEFGVAHLCKFRESQNLGITLPNGSEAIFASCDNEEKLLSLHDVDSVWVEECSQCPVEVIHQLFLRTRSNKGLEHENCFFFSFNPTSELNWTKKQLVEDPEIIKNGVIHHSTYKDNTFLSEDYIQRIEAMKVSNPRNWKVFGLGLWGTQGDLVYEGNWRTEYFNYEELLQSGRYEVMCACDWGFHDPLAFLAGLVDVQNKRLYLFKELYQKGWLNSQFAEWLKKEGFDKCRIIADSSEPKTIQAMKSQYNIRKMEGAVKGADSIKFGIDYVSTWEIIVHPTLVNTIMEFESYSWKVDKKTGKTLDTPDDSYNHIMDCLRYLLEPYGLKTKNKIKTLSKSALGL